MKVFAYIKDSLRREGPVHSLALKEGLSRSFIPDKDILRIGEERCIKRNIDLILEGRKRRALVVIPLHFGASCSLKEDAFRSFVSRKGGCACVNVMVCFK